jgi:hypothetical protein
MSVKNWIDRWREAVLMGAPVQTWRKRLPTLGVATSVHHSIRFWIGVLIVLSWANPVCAAGPHPTWGDRYKSVDGYVTLSFQEPPPAGSRLTPAALTAQFVNQTPKEHWIGELGLNPEADQAGHRRGRFRDVSPGSDPQIVCTGEVDLQGRDRPPDDLRFSWVDAARTVADHRLTLAFKITGGEHCEAMLGDQYQVDFVAVSTPDQPNAQPRD